MNLSIGKSNKDKENKEFIIEDYIKFGQSKEDAIEIKRVFDMLDTDQSGTIDPNELKAAFNDLGLDVKEKTVYQIMAELDDDNSGVIEFPEFYKLCTGNKVDPNSKMQVQNTFNLFDFNESGKITLNELRMVADFLDENMTEEELLHMFKKADKNDDGFVTFEDFYNIIYAGDRV